MKKITTEKCKVCVRTPSPEPSHRVLRPIAQLREQSFKCRGNVITNYVVEANFG